MRWGFWFVGVLGAADFEKDIRPLFAKHCLGCHGAKLQMNGFRLDNGTAALKGGYSGAALVPGRPDESRLFDRVTSDKEGYAMPPNGARLMDNEVRALREWITEGARFPAANAATNPAPAKSKHWAWQPLPSAFAHQTIDGFVRHRLAREKITAQVVNASISGDTTAGGRTRIGPLLDKHRPSLVIVELGGNDALRGLDLSATEANLRAITQAARRGGAKVLLLGMMLPPNFGADYGRRFQALYEKVAAGEGATLVPFFLDGIAERFELFQPDRIHPTEQAQPRMLENVWKVLARML